MSAVELYRLEKAASAVRNAARLAHEREKIAEVCASLNVPPPRLAARLRRAAGDSPRAEYDRRWYRENREKKIAAVKAATERRNRKWIRRFDG
jgi:hypothetical protein